MLIIYTIEYALMVSIKIITDQFGMSLDELYRKVSNTDLPRHILLRLLTSSETNFRQFRPAPDDGARDAPETVRDSIHLDWSPVIAACPECGVRVKIWDGFAHRTLWNRTWLNAVAFQPVSTRFETGRWDSPVEGFAFRLWEWDEDDSGDTFTAGKRRGNVLGDQADEDTTEAPVSRHAAEEDEDEEDNRMFAHDDVEAIDENEDDYYSRWE
jgi:hypothetical protein